MEVFMSESPSLPPRCKVCRMPSKWRLWLPASCCLTRFEEPNSDKQCSRRIFLIFFSLLMRGKIKPLHTFTEATRFAKSLCIQHITVQSIHTIYSIYNSIVYTKNWHTYILDVISSFATSLLFNKIYIEHCALQASIQSLQYLKCLLHILS